MIKKKEEGKSKSIYYLKRMYAYCDKEIKINAKRYKIRGNVIRCEICKKKVRFV